MQLCPLAAEFVAGFDADAHMFVDRAFVEAVGLAGEFEFAVQRFVADTQERAVGDAETITLRSNGG